MQDQSGETRPCDLIRIAPVLCGIKAAELIKLDEKKVRRFLRCIRPLRLRRLRIRGGCGLYLVYDPALLDEALSGPLAKQILCMYGYPVPAERAAMLDALSFRFRACEFPHEIGLFLGYPPGDVRAFIQSGGRDCLLSGYWKVYDDVDGAREIFDRIDAARTAAITCIQASQTTAQAVLAIKTYGKAVPI